MPESLGDATGPPTRTQVFKCPTCQGPMYLWHTWKVRAGEIVERLYRCASCELEDPGAPGLRTIERTDGPFRKRGLASPPRRKHAIA